MSIQSHAFGRVTLTDGDAEKFRRQVKYGQPKPAAVEGIRRGVELSRDMQRDGSVTVWVKKKRRVG